jgi:hypothetical protein
MCLAWPTVKDPRLRLKRAAGVAAAAMMAGWLPLWYIVNADTIRIDYAAKPSIPQTSGVILVAAGSAPQKLTLSCYVEDQARPIKGFDRRVGPPETPANAEVAGDLDFDRTVTVTGFVRPQWVRLQYTLGAPAIMAVSAYSEGTPVLFQEAWTWYRWAIHVYAFALGAVGALLAWQRS